MNISEYNKIKDLNYLQYCDYLQDKYGLSKYNYMTKSWNKVQKVTRTKEGLIAHHKYENRTIMLSTKEFAMNFPFEWQLAENLVYADYLEHLLLHIMITENPCTDEEIFGAVGIGGVVNFIGPELNDYYSGWVTGQGWRKTCHDQIKDDKEVYLAMLKRFKTTCKKHPLYDEKDLLKSYNQVYGLWNNDKNKAIYQEIKNL